MASTGSITTARRALDILRTLRGVTDENRTPTPDERALLAAWPGWGPLAPAFDPDPEGTWATIADDIAALTTERQWKSAAQGVDTAFYTPQHIVDALWGVLRDAGFTGGRVLEPGCGSGRFMSGAPAGLPVQFVGVEADPVSARIASLVHPRAEIITGRLEKAALPGKFDAVIGNVPFSSARVGDNVIGSHALHQYFVLRGLSSLREGGYMAVVSSSYTLDAQSNILNTLLGDRDKIGGADFVGAVRLPAGTFAADGTSVVCDVLVFRKNTHAPKRAYLPAMPLTDEEGQTYSTFIREAREPEYTPWGGYRVPSRVEEAGDAKRVHAYWRDYPEHVAGRIVPSSNPRAPFTVASDDPAGDTTAAFAALAREVERFPMFTDSTQTAADYDDVEFMDAEGRKEGSFHLIGGALHQVKGGALVAARKSAELTALVGLRDLAVDLLAAEADRDAPDESMAGLRAETLAAYEAYTAKWGPLNRGTLHVGKDDPDTGAPSLSWRTPTLGGFRADPDSHLVFALEQYDQDSGTASPAPILTQRVNRAPEPVTSADSPAEALAVVLGERGQVDLGRVASLLGLPSEDAAERALGSLVYRDPAQYGALVPARTYLSGNVRLKHAQAVAAAATDPDYQVNVDALAQVIPADLGPHDIRLYLGNPILRPRDIKEFVGDLLGSGPSVLSVGHTAATATWDVDSRGSLPSTATTTWGTSRMDAVDLIRCALNGKAPVVYDEEYYRGAKKRTRNADETTAAQAKMTAIQDRFSTWVWEDPERAQRLAAEYNRRFNSHVERQSDGSYLRFDGLSEAVTPYKHQRDFVDRALSTPGALCAHPVGAGKTLEMILTAMTLRQFGLARKPMIAVPNHLLEQIAREVQQAYPMGRFLVVTKDDLHKDRRRAFAARCATGDWDAVIITHQGFSSLPVSPRVEREWIEAQKDLLNDGLRVKDGGYAGAKVIARRLRSLEGRLDRLRDTYTDHAQVLFEHLGVDYLMVDESHMFKRLPIVSAAEGFSMGASKRATDLLIKVRWLESQAQGRPFCSLYTGTPWTNSLVETYVWQTYLHPEGLAAAGVEAFDAWAAVFVRRETVVEVAPDGSGFRTVTRPTKMTNMPRLRSMLAQFADVLSADDIGLERPDRVTESYDVDPSAEQAAYVAGLVKRAEDLRSGVTANPSENMLTICGDGRRAALDPHLVGVNGESPKVAAAAERIAQVYQEHRAARYPGSDVPGALQVVFCDQGTPGPERGQQTYGRLKEALVAQGVPADRVRMIHEAKDDKARAALFAACRDGRVSVLIGSTEKMGTGTNIQTRLVALHHLDAPWRPSDVEQRDGRALRPGNRNAVVSICRYVTRKTFDAFMWQTLERKAIAFTAMYDRHSTVVEVDDVSDVAPSYTQMKALASGSPLLLEQAEVAAEVKRLRTMRAVDRQGIVRAGQNVRAAESRANGLRQLAERVREFLDAENPDAEQSTAVLADRAAAFVQRYRNGGGGYRPGIFWRGLFATPNHDGNGGLNVEIGYRAAGVLDVRPKKGAKARAVREIVTEFTAFWDALPGRAEDLEAKAAQVEEQAVRDQALIDEYVFPQADALADAEARLRRINHALEMEAEDAERGPSATEATAPAPAEERELVNA